MRVLLPEPLSPLRGFNQFTDAFPRAGALGFILPAPVGAALLPSARHSSHKLVTHHSSLITYHFPVNLGSDEKHR